MYVTCGILDWVGGLMGLGVLCRHCGCCFEDFHRLVLLFLEPMNAEEEEEL